MRLCDETCGTNMAPRFVEVLRPVQEGVRFASALPDVVLSLMSWVLPRNTVDVITNTMTAFEKCIPNIKAWTDFKLAVIFLVESLPPVRNEVSFLLKISVFFLLFRSAFVRLCTRSILLNYGASNAILKDKNM